MNIDEILFENVENEKVGKNEGLVVDSPSDQTGDGVDGLKPQDIKPNPPVVHFSRALARSMKNISRQSLLQATGSSSRPNKGTASGGSDISPIGVVSRQKFSSMYDHPGDFTGLLHSNPDFMHKQMPQVKLKRNQSAKFIIKSKIQPAKCHDAKIQQISRVYKMDKSQSFRKIDFQDEYFGGKRISASVLKTDDTYCFDQNDWKKKMFKISQMAKKEVSKVNQLMKKKEL